MSYSFMHYRKYNTVDGTVECRGGSTVAILERESAPDEVIISVARCRNDEVFNKALGRNIASERIRLHVQGMRDTNVTYVPIPENMNVKVAVDYWLFHNDVS